MVEAKNNYLDAKANREPTEQQCIEVSKKIIKLPKEELEHRGFDWDWVVKKLKEETEYEEPVVLKKYKVVKVGKKGKEVNKLVTYNEIVYIKTPDAMDIRQKGRKDVNKLRDDYPPEEKRISGPGGGPIPITRLAVEFVKPGQIDENK